METESIASEATETTAKQPLATFTNGAARASVFRDTLKNNGEERITYSISFAKRYFDRKSNAWCTSHSLFPADLPNAIRSLTRALDFVEQHQDRQS